MAINVALYGPGGRWAMTERGSPALRRDAATLQVGPSAFRFDGTTLVLDIDEIAAPLPRRIRGRLRIHPEFLAGRTFALDPAGLHLWRPIAPVARIEVELEAPALSWRGSAYVDHNRGTEPLENGFRSWSWTRAAHSGGADIAWSTQPRGARDEAFAVSFDRSGATTVAEAPPSFPLRRTLWGMQRPVASEDGAVVRLEKTLEDTPFYCRSIVTARTFGRTVTGIHESLSLDRFRSPVVQLMLPFRMPRRRCFGP